MRVIHTYKITTNAFLENITETICRHVTDIFRKFLKNIGKKAHLFANGKI